MSETQRIDQWLWHARFFKTRGLATRLVASGKLRVDGAHVSKPAFALRPGMTLTFPQARRVRVIRVDNLAARRGPAPEARTLYTDLTPAPETEVPANPRYEGKGRPTKKDRRSMGLSGRPPLD
ncbi:MAG: RNA-binding S4 domain-containing protein [Silicimonas sp.]|nr:RNA-binding S4 domain-containing protein [Silicimonas sp.]NNF92594.1 RNA-binding S4 domain-containing protein [Boseongicola sp.]RZW09059.1 MAG: RNA-binding S4 domain-containing protein [Paracoccaceae bacterium]NND17516.1 RNA-binding S4 domain-containing protein [Silicimonas sp.]NND41397.1 RNA-binding S4 domain-containing protein [Silicimonas sp.]